MLKPAVEEAPEPITDGNTSVTPEVTQPAPNALNVNPENVVSMENNTPAVQPNVTRNNRQNLRFNNQPHRQLLLKRLRQFKESQNKFLQHHS